MALSAGERSREPAKEKDKDGLRITDQFRGKGGMTYDFRGGGERLTLCFAPRTNSEDAGEWRAEARSGKATEVAVVAEWGSTRADALRAVGASWEANTDVAKFPRFDWEHVERALTAVRAL